MPQYASTEYLTYLYKMGLHDAVFLLCPDAYNVAILRLLILREEQLRTK